MKIQELYDPKTFTLTFVAYDEATHDAVVIDPVLDYEPGPLQTSTASVDALSRFIEREALTLRYVLETHAHADHLSRSQLFKQRQGARVAIGARITDGAGDLPGPLRPGAGVSHRRVAVRPAARRRRDAPRRVARGAGDRGRGRVLPASSLDREKIGSLSRWGWQ